MKSVKHIASAINDQPTWRTSGLEDLRVIAPHRIEVAPALVAGANSIEDAIEVMRHALGIAAGESIAVNTPKGTVRIADTSLHHVVEKRQDQRERFSNMAIPTLERPTEIWQAAYDDGTVRDRYIKLFSSAKYDILVMVKVDPDGGIFWNMMQRDRKGMNALRMGTLTYESH